MSLPESTPKWFIHIFHVPRDENLNSAPWYENHKERNYEELSKSDPLYTVSDFYTQLDKFRPINIPPFSYMQIEQEFPPQIIFPNSIKIQIRFPESDQGIPSTNCCQTFIGLLINFVKEPNYYSNNPLEPTTLIHFLTLKRRQLVLSIEIDLIVKDMIPGQIIHKTTTLIDSLSIPGLNHNYKLDLITQSKKESEISKVNAKNTADSVRHSLRQLQIIP